MNVPTQTVDEVRTSTRWRTAREWLRAIDEAVNFDPHEFANNTARNLAEKVARLETKVNELENKG